MRRLTVSFVVFFGLFSLLQAEPAGITWAGQTYRLGRSSRLKAVDTDEYIPATESVDQWSRLLTVQRLGLGLADFVTHLERSQPEVEWLRRGRRACVFRTTFKGSLPDGAQQVLGLAYLGEGGRLLVVHFAVKTALVTETELKLQLEAWLPPFLAQVERSQAEERP